MILCQISIRQYNRHDTEILIDTDDKLSDYNILKNVVILTICVIEDGAYQQYTISEYWDILVLDGIESYT